jgi:DNA repair exonuclease SbcCD ATPase subunit
MSPREMERRQAALVELEERLRALETVATALQNKQMEDMRALAEERDAALTRVSAVSDENEALRADLLELRAAVKASLAKRKDELLESQAQLSEARERAAMLAGQVAELQAAATTSQDFDNVLEALREDRRANLEKSERAEQKRIAAMRILRGDMAQAVGALQRQLANVQRQLGTVEGQLGTVEGQLDEVQGDLADMEPASTPLTPVSASGRDLARRIRNLTANAFVEGREESCPFPQ